MTINRLNQRATRSGSVLVIALVTAAVMGAALAAVLSLTVHEHRMLVRTADWNAALPVAEAGIEEAMSHLRQVNGGNRAVNGWVKEGNNYVCPPRTLSTGRFQVGISATTPPVITSTGFVWCASANRYMARRIEARTQGKGRFIRGLVAEGPITLSGQFASDSFDSSDPDHSANGLYDPGKRKDNGDVATNAGDMEIGGQVKIYGSVATGPEGSIKMETRQAAVGTANYINSGGQGIQEGRSANDMNVSFPDVEEPFTGGAVVPMRDVTINGVKYKLVLYSGNYTLSTLSLSGHDKLLVLGNATLLVNQDVSLSGNASIQINPGANLQLYVKKGNVTLSGQGIANKTGNATNFALWGMPEMKDIKLSGNGELMGTIYAPQARLSLSGGGTSGLDFVGAGIVNEINASGKYKFHYDEALGNAGGKSLILASWREF